MEKRNENDPLLHEDSLIFVNQRYHTAPSTNHFDNPAFEEDSQYSRYLDDDELYEEEQTLSFKEKKNYGISILILDAVLFVVEYLQMFALLQSLSLRWTWPVTWTQSFSFLFIFNIDVWELAKMATSGVYIAARDYYIPSDEIPINYRVMLLGWLICLIVITFAFFVLRWIFINRLQYNALNILMMILIVTVQVLALPIGVQIGKLFWCRPTDNALDVDNLVACWSAEHIVYVVLALLVAVALFLVYPFWLAVRINGQIITRNPRKHEEYLRLKHCEELYDLDQSWSEQSFMSFASFERIWVFHRPINHFIKFVIICFYAGLFTERLVQIGLIFAILLLQLLASLAVRPYRVASFNFPYVWSLACLASSALIGTMQNIENIQSVFLLPSYIWGELILINVAWLAGMLFWIVYFLLRTYHVICPNSAVWPSLLEHGKDKLNENTERYMVACINGRSAVKRAVGVPALLAPVHELSYHIKVLNALACEAEFIHDPLQSSLRDALDNVIQLHNTVSPVSIFSESLKTYVQTTISRLMEVLPAFTRRLHQREFDLILVSRVRRRILLKMFAVACFMRTGREDRAHEPGVRKLWTSPLTRDFIYDEGFHEDDSVIGLDSIELMPKQEKFSRSVKSFKSAGTLTPRQKFDESFA